MNEAELYDFLWSIDARSMDADTVDRSLALVLDHIGCAVFGMELPWVEQVGAAVRRLHPPVADSADGHTARVYGTDDRLPVTQAALLNGTAAHGFDLDDLHYPTMTHPGAVVISAALTMAEAVDATGVELISSVIAGYEVMTRTARVIGLDAGNRGFHATALCGPLGAAAAAAKLRGADRGQFESAVGMAASFGSGIKAFQHGPGGIKRLHPGHAAQSGIMAAEVAMAGLAGPDSALSGRFGFGRVFRFGSDRSDPVDFGETSGSMAIDQTYIKPYAACGAVHGLVRAAETLAADVAGRLDDVARVELGCPGRVIEQNDIPAPTDSLTAQYSAQYAAANGLLGIARRPEQFLPSQNGNPERDRVLAKMHLKYDGQADNAFPESNEGRITIQFQDGSHTTAYEAMSGKSSRGWNVAAQKFTEVAAIRFNSEESNRFQRAVKTLDGEKRVRDVLDVLTEALRHGTS